MFGGAGIRMRQGGGNSKDSSGAGRRREVSQGHGETGAPAHLLYASRGALGRASAGRGLRG